MKTGRKRRSHDTHKFAHRLKKSCCYLFVLFLVVEPSEATRGWNTDRKEKKTASYEREMYLYIISICHRGRKPGVRRFGLADRRSPDLLGRHMHTQHTNTNRVFKSLVRLHCAKDEGKENRILREIVHLFQSVRPGDSTREITSRRRCLFLVRREEGGNYLGSLLFLSFFL